MVWSPCRDGAPPGLRSTCSRPETAGGRGRGTWTFGSWGRSRPTSTVNRSTWALRGSHLFRGPRAHRRGPCARADGGGPLARRSAGAVGKCAAKSHLRLAQCARTRTGGSCSVEADRDAGDAYVLHLDVDELDARRFERAAADGRGGARVRGEHEHAAECARHAHSRNGGAKY